MFLDPHSIACGVHIAEAAAKKKLFGKDKRIIEAQLGLDWWNRPVSDAIRVPSDQCVPGDVLGQIRDEGSFRPAGVVLAVLAHRDQPMLGVDVAILGAAPVRFAFTDMVTAFRARWLPQQNCTNCMAFESAFEANYVVEFLRAQYHNQPVPRMIGIEEALDVCHDWDLVDDSYLINANGRIWMQAYLARSHDYDAALKISAIALGMSLLTGWTELSGEQTKAAGWFASELLRKRDGFGPNSIEAKQACDALYRQLTTLPLRTEEDVMVEWLRYHASI